MKTFPSKLIPSNKHLFPKYKFNREVCKLRQKVVDYLYSGEKGGLDLKVSSDSNYNFKNINKEVVNQVIKELEDLGWKTKLVYADTTLLIYEDEKELDETHKNGEEIDC